MKLKNTTIEKGEFLLGINTPVCFFDKKSRAWKVFYNKMSSLDLLNLAKVFDVDKIKDYNHFKALMEKELDIRKGGAKFYRDGLIKSFKNGKYHRDDGPAVLYTNKGKSYYQNGELHREDGPAVIAPGGYRAYWLNGKRHRIGGPAVVGAHNKFIEYHQNGKLHREDGPAVICANGRREYWLNGKLHRRRAPAVIYKDGMRAYYSFGKHIKTEHPSLLGWLWFLLKLEFSKKARKRQLLKLGGAQ